MKLALALAAILALGIRHSGQQTAHPEPIPTYPGGHAEQLPNAEVPIQVSSTSSFGQIVQAPPALVMPPKPCVIVEDAGTDYKYVEGAFSGVASSAKLFTDSDIHKIVGAGGWVEILKRGYSADDLARLRKVCKVGITTTELPLPAKKQ